MAGQHGPERAHALAKASSLLRQEMRRWVRKGDAFDEVVGHLSQQP